MGINFDIVYHPLVVEKDIPKLGTAEKIILKKPLRIN